MTAETGKPENRKDRSLKIGYMAAAVPAVLLGVGAMAYHGEPLMLWGQQAAALAVFAALAVLLRRVVKKVNFTVWSTILLLLLAATLLGTETGGAKRWVNLRVIHVNAALLVLPALLLLAGDMKRPWAALLFSGAVVCLQPDTSQMAALFAAALPILWKHRRNVLLSAVSLALLAAGVIKCLLTPVSLEPVLYCEGILSMLGGISPALQIVGWLALTLIPGFMAYAYMKKREPQLLSLLLYYSVTLLFTLQGTYPVPLMGFGVSPVAGYYLAYPLILRYHKNT